MQNLLQWLWRRRVMFAFVALQVVAITFVVSANSYHRTAVVTSANEVTGGLMKRYSSIRDFINLNETNKNLAAENAALRSALKSSYFQIYADHDSIIDTLYQQQYTYIDAEVINNSIHKRNNYITLNRGRIHGLEEDMAVINGFGAVGVIADVSDHYASVIPIIHGKSRLPGKFQNSSFFGSISWPSAANYREARLSDIPRQATIRKGDTIVTDTRSALYPSGIPIGIVDTFYIEPQDQFYEVELNLTVDFAALQKVYVIKNLLKGERLLLESEQEDED